MEKINSILPGWTIEVLTGDTQCSSAIGPLEAVRLQCQAGHLAFEKRKPKVARYSIERCVIRQWNGNLSVFRMCPVFIAQDVTEGNKAVFNEIGRSALPIGEFEVTVLFMAVVLVNAYQSAY